MKNRMGRKPRGCCGTLLSITAYAMTSSCACILARRTSLRICCAIWSGSSGYSITLTGIAMETSLTAAKMKN